MKYKSYILIAFLTFAFNAFSQDDKYPSFLKADDSWGSEIIPFPVDWAPGMTIIGYEELRFSPSWSDPESEGFWSLVMGWNVKASAPLEAEVIANNLQYYFDGLMKPNHWATTFPDPVVQLEVAGGGELMETYKGHLAVFDGFHTGKNIKLHIRATQNFDEELERTFVIIQFSPQSYEHPIWEKLQDIVLKSK